MESIRIDLPFPPSVNGLYAGKARRYPSKAYKKWLQSCPRLDVSSPWAVNFVVYVLKFPDNRERDGQSYFKATTDYLVKNGVFIDDNRKIIKSEIWLDGGVVGKDSAGVSVYIFPYEGFISNPAVLKLIADTLQEG